MENEPPHYPTRLDQNLLDSLYFNSSGLSIQWKPAYENKKLRTFSLKFSTMHHLNKNFLQPEYSVKFLMYELY